MAHLVYTTRENSALHTIYSRYIHVYYTIQGCKHFSIFHVSPPFFCYFKRVCNISNSELNLFDKPTDLISCASAMIFLTSSPPKMFDFTKNELLSTFWDIGNLFNSSFSQQVHLSFLHNAIKIVIVSSTSLRSSIYPGRVRNIYVHKKYNITHQ